MIRLDATGQPRAFEDHEVPETIWSYSLAALAFSSTGVQALLCPLNQKYPDGEWRVCREPIWASVHKRPLPTPPIGFVLKCFACALEKPWGVFDTTTGAVMCVECRDSRDYKRE